MTRLPESCINVPGSMALAATGDPETTYLAGKLTGEELRSLGVNFNLAPSVDVNCNPANPIIGCAVMAIPPPPWPSMPPV